MLHKRVSPKKRLFPALVIAAIVAAATCIAIANPTATNSTPVLDYRVVNAYPHDKAAFTQGLAYDKGILFEGTGLYGQSTLRKVNLQTGTVIERVRLPDLYFGEGIAIWNDRLVQLTWQSGRGFIYDKKSLRQISNFTYETEGWGITSDGERLIMSDGTDDLYFLDPETLIVTGKMEVKDGAHPVRGINELEYINGEIFANIWPTDKIAIISPQTGAVRAWIDLHGILPLEDRLRGVDVLNGIAYDALNDRIFVTGKLWSKLFEIELVARDM
jgi:glutamine cyclotransferase